MTNGQSHVWQPLDGMVVPHDGRGWDERKSLTAVPQNRARAPEHGDATGGRSARHRALVHDRFAFSRHFVHNITKPVTGRSLPRVILEPSLAGFFREPRTTRTEWGGHVDTSTATVRNAANRLVEVEEILNRRGHTPTELIGVLQDIQERWHYLPEDALNYVATTLGMSVNTVFGVATFYAQFSLEPKGKYLVRICDGTACHVKGSTPIYDAIKKTRPARRRVTTVTASLPSDGGLCGGLWHRALVINDQVHSQLTPKAAEIIIDTLMARERARPRPTRPATRESRNDHHRTHAGRGAPPMPPHVGGRACASWYVRAPAAANSAAAVYAAIDEAIRRQGGGIAVEPTDDDAQNGPPRGEHRLPRLLCAAGPWCTSSRPACSIPTSPTTPTRSWRPRCAAVVVTGWCTATASPARRTIMPRRRPSIGARCARCWRIAATWTGIEEYIALGSYAGLMAITSMTPEQVCEQVLASKLRPGRRGLPRGSSGTSRASSWPRPSTWCATVTRATPAPWTQPHGDPHRVLEG